MPSFFPCVHYLLFSSYFSLLPSNSGKVDMFLSLTRQEKHYTMKSYTYERCGFQLLNLLRIWPMNLYRFVLFTYIFVSVGYKFTLILLSAQPWTQLKVYTSSWSARIYGLEFLLKKYIQLLTLSLQWSILVYCITMYITIKYLDEKSNLIKGKKEHLKYTPMKF